MRRTTFSTITCLAVLVWLGAPAITADDDLPKLKRTIAVVDFEDKTDRSRWNWAGPDPGSGMADMLTTALVQAGEFRVIERQQLARVLDEQSLGQAGITTPQTAAQVGKVLGVSAIVYGAITEFGYKKEESGGAVSQLSKLGNVGVKYEKQEARVACDIRIVDTTTAEIIAAESYAKGDSKRGAAVRTSDFGFGHDSKFDQSLVGKATRKVIDEVVEQIADTIDGLPWTGRVVKADGPARIFLNAGAEGGAAAGMIFDVYRPGEELIDPSTGLSLGTDESHVGSIEIITVKEKYSICKATAGSDFQAGDIVRSR